MKTQRNKKPKPKAKKVTIKDLPSKSNRDDAVRGGAVATVPGARLKSF